MSNTRPYRNFQLRIFALSWLSYAFYYVSRKNFSIVKTTLNEDLGFSITDLGMVETIYASCYMLGQFVSGILGDKYGARKVLSAGMCLSALSSITMGLTNYFTVFAISMALNGCFQSTGWANNLKVMTPWFSKNNRGRVTGAWCTCYTVGPIIAAALATWLLATYSWQMAMIVPGITVAVVALLIFFFLVDSPEEVGLKPLDEHEQGEEFVDVPITTKIPLFSLLQNPIVLSFGISYAFIKFIRYSITFWLPWYLEKRLHYAQDAAGYMSIAFEVGGFAGVILIGYLSDKFFKDKRANTVVLSLFVMAACLFAYQYAGSISAVVNVVLLALVGLTLFGGDSVLSASATQDIGDHNTTASAAGIVNGIGSLGGVAGGIVPALISVRYGWDALFYLFIVAALFAGTFLYFAINRQNKQTTA